MGHRTPTVALSRGAGVVARRGGFLKHKQRLKWKKNDGRRKQGVVLAQGKIHGQTRFQENSTDFARIRETQYPNISKNFERRHEYYAPPDAPRNTTSYIIQSKCMQGVAPVVTPSPITPAVLPTPGLSPLPRYKEQFADEVNEWGVNGYGSMNGLIRVRTDVKEDSESENHGNRSFHAQSVQQVEQRLDQGLSRFEIVYHALDAKAPLQEIRLVAQENHIAHLEQENNTLKVRLNLMEQELDDLRSRMQLLADGSDHCELGEVLSEESLGNNGCAAGIQTLP